MSRKPKYLKVRKEAPEPEKPKKGTLILIVDDEMSTEEHMRMLGVKS